MIPRFDRRAWLFVLVGTWMACDAQPTDALGEGSVPDPATEPTQRPPPWDCAAPAQIRRFAAGDAIFVGRAVRLAAIPGRFALLRDGGFFLFRAGSSADPTSVGFEGLTGGSPETLVTEGGAPVLGALSMQRDRPPEITTWALEDGRWVSQGPALVLGDRRVLDVAVVGRRPAAAVLSADESSMSVVGLWTWTAPHNGWRSPVRIFSDAGLIASRDHQPASSLRVQPFDFDRGVPSGPAWDGPACFRSGYVGPDIDFDIVRAPDGAVLVLSSCEGSVRLQRRDASSGAVEVERTWMGAQEAPGRLALDAAGQLAVLTWPSGASGPLLRLLDAQALTAVRSAVPIDRDDPLSSRPKAALDVVADAEVSGRFAMTYALISGHGSGQLELVQVELCQGG